MLNRFWRFMLEASLEIMFVSMISLVKSKEQAGEESKVEERESNTPSTAGDKFMIVYTILLLVAVFVFTCSLIWYVVAGFKTLL